MLVMTGQVPRHQAVATGPLLDRCSMRPADLCLLHHSLPTGLRLLGGGELRAGPIIDTCTGTAAAGNRWWVRMCGGYCVITGLQAANRATFCDHEPSQCSAVMYCRAAHYWIL
jgi:hypothetical protein